jgi:hypothetical protein
MSTAIVPASMDEALAMLRSAAGYLAGLDPADLPADALAGALRAMEQADAVAAAARGAMLAAFAAQDGPVTDGQRNIRTWLVHSTRVTGGQAGQYLATERLAREHPVLRAGLAGGDAFTKSVGLQLARWTRAIPAEYRQFRQVPHPGELSRGRVRRISATIARSGSA